MNCYLATDAVDGYHTPASKPDQMPDKDSAWKGPEMTTRFSRAMTDDQLRTALMSAPLEEIEAALASGDLTQRRMAQVTISAHHVDGSGEAISMRETSELPMANTPMLHEHRRKNEQMTDVLRQLKDNKRNSA